MGVPIINLGGHCVHAVDSLHEGGRDASGEEIDEGVFVGDLTEGYMVFEFGNVIP